MPQNKDKCKKFSLPHFYNLGIGKIRELGWGARKRLLEMYINMIEVIKRDRI